MSFEKLNEAGFKAIGTNPEFTDQATYTGAPSAGSSGVQLDDTPKTIGLVALREEAHRRTVRYKVTTFDLTVTVYDVIIDGNTVSYDASSELPADNDALIAGIAAAIDADGTVGPLVNASVDPNDPEAVLIVGVGEDDYTFDGDVTGGSGAIELSGDATSADVRLWLSHGGTLANGSVGYENGWVMPDGGDIGTIDRRGYTDRYDTAGYRQGYIELENVAGVAGDGATTTVTPTVARVALGPAKL